MANGANWLTKATYFGDMLSAICMNSTSGRFLHIVPLKPGKETAWLGENDGLLNHIYLDGVTLRGCSLDTRVIISPVILVPFLHEGDRFFLVTDLLVPCCFLCGSLTRTSAVNLLT